MTQKFTKLALFAAITGALCALGGAAVAASKTAAPSTGHKPDAEAIDALVKMSGYLQTVKQFDLDVNSTTDQIMVDGSTTQLIQLSHSTKMTVSRPDSLKADIVGGAPGTSRHAIYDGKSFTLYTEPGNYYTTVPAPSTIKALMSDLESKYGVELPLSDIFSLGENPAAFTHVISAVYVGDEVVSGNTCSHYAYHEKHIDWQIWIRKGDQPLPCKLNIVTLADNERPQYTAVYHWNLKPEITPATFKFTPPENAHKINFVQSSSAK